MDKFFLAIISAGLLVLLAAATLLATDGPELLGRSRGAQDRHLDNNLPSRLTSKVWTGV
jgi:hypothetical protein